MTSDSGIVPSVGITACSGKLTFNEYNPFPLNGSGSLGLEPLKRTSELGSDFNVNPGTNSVAYLAVPSINLLLFSQVTISPAPSPIPT